MIKLDEITFLSNDELSTLKKAIEEEEIRRYLESKDRPIS